MLNKIFKSNSVCSIKRQFNQKKELIMLKRVFIGILVVLMMVGVSFAREYEGIEMPETLEAGDTILVLNGVGERSVFMQQVYVVGLYLTGPEEDDTAVLEADEPMGIKLHVTNAFFASSKRVMDALYKGFRNNVPNGDITPIKDKVEKFNQCFSGEISEHDVFDITYLPDQGVTVSKNGEPQDTVPGYEFKKNVFGIWIGETPVQKDMKTAMLSGDVTDEALAMKDERLAQLEKEKEQKMAAAQAAKEKAAAEKKKAEEAAAAAKKEAAMKAEKELAAKEKAAKEKAAAAGTAATATAEKAARELISKNEFVSTDVNFALNSNNLSKAAKQELDDKAAWLKANPGVNVVLEGHSDARGPKDLNYRLAKQRAQSVKDYMVKAGIDASRIEVKSYGEEKPLVPGDNKAAWTKNRRVHFRIVK